MENQICLTQQKEALRGNKTENNCLVDDTLSVATGMYIFRHILVRLFK